MGHFIIGGAAVFWVDGNGDSRCSLLAWQFKDQFLAMFSRLERKYKYEPQKAADDTFELIMNNNNKMEFRLGKDSKFYELQGGKETYLCG